MLGKIIGKSIIGLLMGAFIISCAPKYAGHFQLKSHEMDRYTIKEVPENEKEPLITSADEVKVEDEVVIKEVITNTEQLEEIARKTPDQVIKPSNTEELIEAIKNDPDATVALNINKLSKKEKRALKKEVKKQLKEHKNSAGVLQYEDGSSKVLYYILAIFIPPLAVGLWRGIGKDFWINLLLTLLLLLPGIIHAIIVISSKPKITGTGAAY